MEHCHNLRPSHIPRFFCQRPFIDSPRIGPQMGLLRRHQRRSSAPVKIRQVPPSHVRRGDVLRKVRIVGWHQVDLIYRAAVGVSIGRGMEKPMRNYGGVCENYTCWDMTKEKRKAAASYHQRRMLPSPFSLPLAFPPPSSWTPQSSPRPSLPSPRPCC